MQKRNTLLSLIANNISNKKGPGIEKLFNAWAFLCFLTDHSPRSPPFHFFSTSRNEKMED